MLILYWMEVKSLPLGGAISGSNIMPDVEDIGE